MATPNLSVQNWYETTLSSGISSTDTTIPLNVVPTPSEGYLVIEPDSSTNREVIYFNSKTGSGVVAPSVALGRGVDGTTAISHSTGSTVRMEITKGNFDSLQDGTALTGLHTNNTDSQFDYVVSGLIWTADAAGSTRNGSLSSGFVRINGRKFTVAAVSAHSFTASKDTYVDILYSATDNTGTVVYTEVTNNAASPALASNSVRIAIVITGATSIAAASSINQGQEDRVLPIASSIPYAVTDSLGNLICPRDPNRKILGYRQRTSDFTSVSAGTSTIITGITVPFIAPANRKIRVTLRPRYAASTQAAGNGVTLEVRESSTVIADTSFTTPVAGYAENPVPSSIITPSAGLHTYDGYIFQAAAGTMTFSGSSTSPAYILVELF